MMPCLRKRKLHFVGCNDVNAGVANIADEYFTDFYRCVNNLVVDCFHAFKHFPLRNRGRSFDGNNGMISAVDLHCRSEHTNTVRTFERKSPSCRCFRKRTKLPFRLRSAQPKVNSRSGRIRKQVLFSLSYTSAETTSSFFESE